MKHSFFGNPDFCHLLSHVRNPRKNIAASHQGEAAKIFLRPSPLGGGRAGCRRLGGQVRAEGGGELGEHGVELDGGA